MKPTKYQLRLKRGNRVRNQIGNGTAARPRLVVFRSNTAVTAQIINDEAGKTLAFASTPKGKSNTEAAKAVGTEIAKAAKAAKITTVIFDRSGYKFHGRVKALAEAARESGLQF